MKCGALVDTFAPLNQALTADTNTLCKFCRQVEELRNNTSAGFSRHLVFSFSLVAPCAARGVSQHLGIPFAVITMEGGFKLLEIQGSLHRHTPAAQSPHLLVIMLIRVLRSTDSSS
jgi:hypothetical protein